MSSSPINSRESPRYLCGGTSRLVGAGQPALRWKFHWHQVSAATESLRNLEGRALLTCLATHRGSRRALANELGISKRTLYRRLRKLGGKSG